MEYINLKMEEEGVFFHMVELGGNVSKYDRIKRLVPLFQKGRFILPKVMVYTNNDGETTELIQDFLDEEYLAFPYCRHDDMLDAMSRITESGMGVVFPTRTTIEIDSGPTDDPLNLSDSNDPGTWMSW